MEDVEHLNYVNKLVFHHSSDHGKGKHRITEQVMILHKRNAYLLYSTRMNQFELISLKVNFNLK